MQLWKFLCMLASAQLEDLILQEILSTMKLLQTKKIFFKKKKFKMAFEQVLSTVSPQADISIASIFKTCFHQNIQES